MLRGSAMYNLIMTAFPSDSLQEMFDDLTTEQKDCFLRRYQQIGSTVKIYCGVCGKTYKLDDYYGHSCKRIKF